MTLKKLNIQNMKLDKLLKKNKNIFKNKDLKIGQVNQ